MEIDNEINESVVVSSTAVSSGSYCPSDTNQGYTAESENEDEFIPESDINDNDEGLSDEVFGYMFQEVFFAYDDDDTGDKKANEKLLR